MKDEVILLDDDIRYLSLGKTILSEVYNVKTARSWPDLRLLLAGSFSVPSCILIDLMINDEHCCDLIKKLHEYDRLKNVPVIVVTDQYNSEIQEAGFDAGAFDFILKPYHGKVMKKRVERAVKMFHLQEKLQQEVEIQTAEAVRQKEKAESTLTHVVDALTCTIEAKDYYTKGHSLRVSFYSRVFAEELGVDVEKVEEIARAGALHDIGKIGVPVWILQKPDHLNTSEFEKIKAHTIMGDTILSSLDELGVACDVARHHHERYNGTGYPDGLKGEEISFPARLVAIADAFDVMSSGRSYQDALSTEKALAEIERCSGTQFDPYMAEVFVRLVKEGKIGPQLIKDSKKEE